MKNVLFLALWFLPQVGGMEMSSYELVRAIEAGNNRITVITADHIESRDFDAKQSFTIIRTPHLFLKKLASKSLFVRMWYYVLYYIKFFITVKRTIRVINPDTIIIADEQTRNWYGFFSSFIPYKPIVIASMPENKSQKLKVRVVSQTLNKAKTILCVSRSTMNKMCDVFGDKYRGKMRVLYRTISDEYFEIPKNQEKERAIRTRLGLNDSFVILSVCRLNKKKGIETLLRAINEIKNTDDIMVVIAGEGPDAERLKYLSQELGISNKVLFLGKLSKEELIYYYDACDLFVLPSEEESFGRVFVEAGAREKVSIGCEVGGVPEIIDHGVNGFLIQPGDYEELAQSIMVLKNNDHLRNIMARTIRSKVIINYSFTMLKSFWENELKTV